MSIDEDVTGDLTTPYQAVLSLCEEFAQEQAEGSTPSIADYLGRVDEESRSTLLRNLLDIEMGAAGAPTHSIAVNQSGQGSSVNKYHFRRSKIGHK